MAEFTPSITPSEISAAVVYFGSQKKAADRLGISRSTVQEIMAGRYGASEAVSRKFLALPQGVQRTLENISGLIESKGVRLSDQRAERERLKHEDKLNPGQARSQAEEFARVMEERGFDPHVRPLPLAPGEVETQAELEAELDRMKAQRYARLIAWQSRELQTRAGGPPVRIVPL